MSVSPAQNFSNPPLVPAAPTVMLTSGFSSLNSSAAASANGCTVDEPSMVIEPERPLAVSPPLAPVGRVVVVAARRHAERENGAGARGEQPLLRDHFLGLLLSWLEPEGSGTRRAPPSVRREHTRTAWQQACYAAGRGGVKKR